MVKIKLKDGSEINAKNCQKALVIWYVAQVAPIKELPLDAEPFKVYQMGTVSVPAEFDQFMVAITACIERKLNKQIKLDRKKSEEEQCHDALLQLAILGEFLEMLILGTKPSGDQPA